MSDNSLKEEEISKNLKLLYSYIDDKDFDIDKFLEAVLKYRK